MILIGIYKTFWFYHISNHKFFFNDCNFTYLLTLLCGKDSTFLIKVLIVDFISLSLILEGLLLVMLFFY